MSKHKTHNYSFSILVSIIVIIIVACSAFLSDFSQKANLIIKKSANTIGKMMTLKVAQGYYSVEQTEADATFYSVLFDGTKEKIATIATRKELPVKSELSPDGKSIFFIDKDWNIAKLDIESKNVEQIRSAFPYDEKNPGSIKPSESIVYNDLKISPDGKKIAVFWSVYKWSTISLMDADGKNFIQIQPSNVDSASFKNFAWSNNSEKFVISCTIDEMSGGNGCLYVAKTTNPSGGINILPSSQNPFPNKIKDAFSPVWSPDDSRITFSYRSEDVTNSSDPIYFNREIFGIDVDGTLLTQLTDLNQYSDSPQYINNKIIYATSSKTGTAGVFYALDKSDSPIFQNKSSYYHIKSVSDDGRHLCLTSGQLGDDYSITNTESKIVDASSVNDQIGILGSFIGWLK